MRSATGTHNHELIGAPDQGARSSGPPETESLAVGRPLGSIQQEGSNEPPRFRDYHIRSILLTRQRKKILTTCTPVFLRPTDFNRMLATLPI
jgi:hypothetical protein